MGKNNDMEINENASEEIEIKKGKKDKKKKIKEDKKKKNKDINKDIEAETKEEATEDAKEEAKENVKEEVKEAKEGPKKEKEDETKEEASDNAKEDIIDDFEDTKSKKSKNKKSEKKPDEVNIVNDLLWLIVYIGIVILICFCIIKFVGCRSRVDGSSMNPTLTDGDNLWVDKLSYTFGDPKRFDIIIFNPNGDENITYVKRIIGLPGETVSMDLDGKIYINGQLLNENYALKETFFPTSIGILSGGNEIVLGDDEYFVLGDNRNNSMDSRRADPGNVKREYIVGKVVLRIYPFSKFGFVD